MSLQEWAKLKRCVNKVDKVLQQLDEDECDREQDEEQDAP